ncbi:pilus assembly protein [Stieleria sp. TO1_6]|uniref:TadE family protein n=1 Tax=Stieleria tagensis TaxID=2956795 RepID=UPI00209B4C0D|nr:TadE/TadG family type IV pilus assembly protein [Stieleria tagensis]MCO8125408.1 pilus assembly protein [Stieleria tagensis]
MKQIRKYNRARSGQRCGAAVVEFALVVPIMLTFTFGLIETSRISMVKEAIIQASREGARVGVRPTADAADVQTRVTEELSLLDLNSATVEVTPTVLEQAKPGDEVRVRITIPMGDISWVSGFFDYVSSGIVAETVMRRESTG